MPLKDRKQLAAALNTLLASPTCASWRQGVSLDRREWLTPKNGRTPAIIVSVAQALPFGLAGPERRAIITIGTKRSA